MTLPVDPRERAEHLLSLQDELDRLEGKESLLGFVGVLFVGAVILCVLGIDHASFYLLLNGAVLGGVAALLGGISWWRGVKKRAVRREIEGFEGPSVDPLPEGEAGERRLPGRGDTEGPGNGRPHLRMDPGDSSVEDE